MRATLNTLLLIVLFTSCIKETPQECPYQYSIQLFVKDKNYFNASGSGNEIPEDLPFREYVSNIYYTVQRISSGDNEIDPVYFEITDNSKETFIILNDIPDGQYTLTVWGNIQHETETGVQNPGFLHVDQEEGTDVYVATTVLNITSGVARNTTLGMERTKGKLQVTLDNLPATISGVEQSVTSLYSSTSNELVYSGETEVNKTFSVNGQNQSVLNTFLAPSVEGNSLLAIVLIDTDNEVMATIPELELSVKRNEISAVRINYNDISDYLEIWILIDKEWVLVRQLSIN